MASGRRRRSPDRHCRPFFTKLPPERKILRIKNYTRRQRTAEICARRGANTRGRNEKFALLERKIYLLREPAAFFHYFLFIRSRFAANGKKRKVVAFSLGVILLPDTHTCMHYHVSAIVEYSDCVALTPELLHNQRSPTKKNCEHAVSSYKGLTIKVLHSPKAQIANSITLIFNPLSHLYCQYKGNNFFV